MTDYTPTTDEVRQAYIWDEEDAAEFDRWLAAHDKEVLDKAARNNAPIGHCNECGHPVHDDGKYWRCVICANDEYDPNPAIRREGA
jgi:rubrerythrin